jgi:hypothetical protein
MLLKESRFGFKPMTWQEEFGGAGGKNPNSDKAASEVFYLPIDPSNHNPVWPSLFAETVAEVLSHSGR